MPSSRSRPTDPAIKSIAARFTESPAKPFEAACGAVLFSLDMVAALGHALADGTLTRQERSELSGRLEVLREQVEALIAGLA